MNEPSRRRPRTWRSLEERSGNAPPAPDPNEEIRRSFLDAPIEGLSATRRSFLRLAGFSFTGAALAGCTRGPAQKAIPALVPSEVVTPGRAYWIATTCEGCAAGCGALAKCRDGRPVKLEGNPGHPVNGGGLCAVGQASVLSLYDSKRLDGPLLRGARVEWAAADAAVREALAAARASGGRVRLLTSARTGPSTLAMVRRFLESVPGARHVAYDALSLAAALDAHAATHGVRAMPRLHFEKAKVIASFDADFLGTWLSPVEFARGYTRARRPDGGEAAMALHVQIESRMSLTGSRADRRIRIGPWETRSALEGLVAALARLENGEPAVEPEDGSAAAAIARLARELWAARGASLVLCGTNDFPSQLAANRANALLGNYGTTLDLAAPCRRRTGDDRALAELLRELDAGEVSVLVVAGGNPAAELPDGAAFARGVGAVPLVVAVAPHLDETAALAHVVLPEPHFLECWNDFEPVAGVVSVSQPAVPPLRSARTLREGLARWLSDERDDLSILRDHWREAIHPRHAGGLPFDAFFDGALRDGFALVRPEPATAAAPAAAPEPVPAGEGPAAPPPGAFAIVLHATVAQLDGRHAHNPWLHELPDPVTKIVWDNGAALSPAAASRLGVQNGDVVRLEGAAGGAVLELPALVQPGQHDGVVAVALGYGRQGTDRFTAIGPRWLEGRPTVGAGRAVGVNAAPLLARDGAGRVLFDSRHVTVAKTGRRHDLACTQDHHTLRVPEALAPRGGEVREAAILVTPEEIEKDPAAAVPRAHEPAGDLWPDDHAREGTRFGMTIDLADCTGCSACVVSCQAENNVPVVGKDEVRRHREMHWLRIDRYWAGDGDDAVTAVHQPMLCQHCGNAPCETVCPVLATVHGREGLNQQVYNRCVGTRYCANNCPYKVRRFNWFDYRRDDRLANMALNPDVTIRSRGVMEKCSFCVQRILEARAEARRKGAAVADGDVSPACEQSCPTRAITFGDLADPESRVSRAARGPRAYVVLGELNVKPSVRYLAAVRRREPSNGDAHGR